MNVADHEPSVLIIGGGPVGFGLAIDLGLRGIRTTVVERQREISPIPKGQNLTQRTMEHFHFWGAEKELRAATTRAPSFGIGGVTAYGTLLGRYGYDWLQRERVRPFYFTDNERLPQYATEKVLRQRAAAIAQITAIYGATCTRIEDHGDFVEAGIGEDDGTLRTIRASYVVGCDGSRSVVRGQAGITQTLSDHDRRMVLLVFRSEELHRLVEARYPGKSFFCVLQPELNGYWKFFGRVDQDATWFFHAPVPADATPEKFDFARLVQGAAGTSFDVAIQHIGFWNLRFAVADAYRQGRVFIAGDAAHSHPPYGGYGLNSGLEDAANLGWKLAATLNGWGGPNLLDSYHHERQPVFASTASRFIEASILADRDFLRQFSPDRDLQAFEKAWQERGSGAKSEVDQFEPNYEGSPIVFGPAGGTCSAVGSHVVAARAGHHFTPLAISPTRNSFDELGRGFTLFAFGADDALVEGFARSAEAGSIPLKIARAERSEALAAYGQPLVLVRPDQYVAWTGTHADDPAAILRCAAGW